MQTKLWHSYRLFFVAHDCGFKLILQDLERRALEIFGIEVHFYFRYVDDIAMAVYHIQLDRLLNIFNSFHPRIQFKIEIGGKR